MTSQQREAETTYDVGESAALPSLADLPDVSRVEGPRTVELDAHYFDTDDLALGRRGITLRRRTGGDDEGWHLKIPVEGARQEIRAPLGRTVNRPPSALLRVVHEVVREQPLHEVATIVTQRTLASVRDADESLLAEVSDDLVTAARKGATDEERRQWREWELEIHAARPRLTKALTKRLRKAGAQPASRSSKLGRLLQLESTGTVGGPRPGVDARVTEHELLSRLVTDLVDDLHRLDPLARADLPDAVHRLRLVVRRLRSALRSFDVCLDTSVTEPVREELHWIGEALGRPRDLEVLQSRLSSLVLTLPPPLVRGRPSQWIDRRLRAERRAAHQEVLRAMAAERYFALLDTVDSWQEGLPWSDRPDRRASKTLPKVLHQEWKRVEKAVKRADGADEADRPDLLHQVRKKAKRARYTAEALEPVLGADAADTAKDATKVQHSLGDHHDALVAMQHVLRLTDIAQEEGSVTFTFGVMFARLEAEVAQHDDGFRRTWKQVR